MILHEARDVLLNAKEEEEYDKKLKNLGVKVKLAIEGKKDGIK